MTRWLLASVVVVAACGRDANEWPKRRLLGLIAEPTPTCGGMEPRPIDALRQRFQEAKNLIRAGKWAEAKKLLEEVQTENPTFGGGTVEQYLTRARREVVVTEHLDLAEKHLDASAWVEAARALARIDLSDTLQTERIGRLRDRLDDDVQRMVEKGYVLMGQSKGTDPMEKLRDLAADIRAIDPENTDAQVLALFAEQALKELEPKRPATKPVR